MGAQDDDVNQDDDWVVGVTMGFRMTMGVQDDDGGFRMTMGRFLYCGKDWLHRPCKGQFLRIKS